MTGGVRFTTVYMALVRSPMISPTKMYDRFPALTDYVRNRGFTLFEDSDAVQQTESTEGEASLDKRSDAFVRATRGIHW